VKQATDRGHIAILATSDPAFGFVAPYGGREPLLTPNPFAIGYPGRRTPVLVEVKRARFLAAQACSKSAMTAEPPSTPAFAGAGSRRSDATQPGRCG
jgi:L-lactate dehydrogenase